MKHYLWQLRPYFRQTAGELLLGSLCGIVMNVAVVLPAILLGRAVDTVLALGRGDASAQDVTIAALLYVGGVLLHEGPRIGKRWWLMTANARIRANLRADALRGVLAWPMARLHTMPVGDLMARIIGDVETLGVGVREFIIETWDTLLFSLSLVVVMVIYDPTLSLWALAPVPFAMWLAQATGRWVRQRTLTARTANAALTVALQEQLQGVRVLRLFGRRQSAVEQVRQLSDRQRRANLATIQLREGLKPLYTTLMTVGVVLVVWLGGLKVIAGAMTVGTLVTYLDLFLRFVNRGFRVPQLFNSIQAGGAAYSRLQPLLAPPLPVRGEPPHASFDPWHVAGTTQSPPLPPLTTAEALPVSLRHVTFHYPATTTPALNDLSLEIAAGALVAVTGPVGAGKSALARALVGLYPLSEGSILLGGHPLHEIPAAERAIRIGYLPQEPHLFSGTVCDNITFGAPIATERITHAVELAALTPDLHSFPAGLETAIGELGVRVSGGQRQRIALARALSAGTQTPGLLVLDDPFSAVDVDTEAQLIAALRHAFGPQAPPAQRATIVLCSHRLAVFPQADQVVVLQTGRVVEQGTHHQLVAQDGLYARIYRAQSQLPGKVTT
jgi:ATP-binding cassette subfamily B protein